jgi:hypothetical protein
MNTSGSGVQPTGDYEKYFEFEKKTEKEPLKEDASSIKKRLDHLVSSRLVQQQERSLKMAFRGGMRGTSIPKEPAGIRYVGTNIILDPILTPAEISSEIDSHRNPKPGGKTVDAFMKEEGANKTPAHWLTDMRDRLVKPELDAFKAAGHTEQEIKYKDAELKEKYNEQVYRDNFSANVNSGLYKPKSMAEEMHEVLQCSDKMPIAIDSTDDLLLLLAEEIDNYKFPETVKSKDPKDPSKTIEVHIQGGKVPCLSKKVIPLLTAELASVIELYKKVYPDKSLLQLFEVCRDLVRIAAYQEHFDRSVFTGSDHGILHIHHNCENGNEMHNALALYEQDNPKAALLSKIVHFYHDTGYSVGAAAGNFAVMKDHPFIGAAFIKANEGYFNRLLGEDETKVLERCILNHAIVSFDAQKLDIQDLYKLVRFTTSNSDACAVSADQKAQRFWRDNPQSIKEIVRLGIFLSIYPDCAKLLGNELIMKSPQKAISAWLKDPNASTDQEVEEWLKNPTVETMPKVFDLDNFKNSIYFTAFKTFVEVRSNLLTFAKREGLPVLEQEAFEAAILNNFNRMGAEIVLKQFGADLVKVSIERNTDEHIAKGEMEYLPQITIAPTQFFPALAETIGRALGGGNITKVLMDEYAAAKAALDAAIKTIAEAGGGLSATAEAHSAVARIYIVKLEQGKFLDKQYQEVLGDLDAVGKHTIPYATRTILNDFIYAITPKENKSKPSETPKDERGGELTKIGDKYYLSKYKEKAFESMSNLLKEDLSAITPEKFNQLSERLTKINARIQKGQLEDIPIDEIFALQSLLANKEDWDFILEGKVERLRSHGDMSSARADTPSSKPPTPTPEDDWTVPSF